MKDTDTICTGCLTVMYRQVSACTGARRIITSRVDVCEEIRIDSTTFKRG